MVATRRNHYRIDHERDGSRRFFSAVLKRLRDSGNDLRRAEQTGFYRAYLEIFQQNFDLIANDSRAGRFNPRHFSRNFRDDARHSGQSINPKSGKSFQIRLNPGASATVGTGDA